MAFRDGALEGIRVPVAWTATAALILCLLIAATFLLLGAQVISEYERLGKVSRDQKPKPLHTD